MPCRHCRGGDSSSRRRAVRSASLRFTSARCARAITSTAAQGRCFWCRTDRGCRRTRLRGNLRGVVRLRSYHQLLAHWRDSRWMRDTRNAVFNTVRTFARAVRAKLPDAPATLAKIAFASAVERAARADPKLAVSHEIWDRDPWLLGTPAGVVDLRNGATLNAAPDLYISRASTVAPATPGSPTPVWSRFLDDVTKGDMDLQGFLQRLSGFPPQCSGEYRFRQHPSRHAAPAGLMQELSPSKPPSRPGCYDLQQRRHLAKHVTDDPERAATMAAMLRNSRRRRCSIGRAGKRPVRTIFLASSALNALWCFGIAFSDGLLPLRPLVVRMLLRLRRLSPVRRAPPSPIPQRPYPG